MRLPNLENAFVEEIKITDYLLSEEKSGGKSTFFSLFGFTLNHSKLLRDALLNHAKEHEVVRISETPHGVKYIIEGRMQTPDRREPQIRSIWIVDAGKESPRFVTAYPLKDTDT